MKKFFSLVLALVMALSLTTVAWGATTTMDWYGGSGPENAAKLTDFLAANNANNELEGATINLTGAYYDLSLPAGTTVPKNLTIVGLLENTPVANCDIKADIDGLTFKNIRFMAGGGINGNAGGDNDQVIKNMKVEECVFDGSHAALNLGSGTCENMTIKNCKFNGTPSSNAIRLFNVSGTTTITGNEIAQAPGYGVSLLGTVAGTVNIDCDAMANITKGALRIDQIQAGAVVSITGNDKIENSALASDMVMKITSIAPGATISITGIPSGAKTLIENGTDDVSDDVTLIDSFSDLTLNADGEITGGTFSDDVSEYVAAGYVFADGAVVNNAGQDVGSSSALTSAKATYGPTLAAALANTTETVTVKAGLNGSVDLKAFPTYQLEKKVVATGVISNDGSQYVIVPTAVNADVVVVDGSKIVYLAKAVGTVKYTDAAKAVKVAYNADPDCGDVYVSAVGDAGTYYLYKNTYYVECDSASASICFNVDGVAVYAKATNLVKTLAHTYAYDVKTVATKTEVTAVYCTACKATFSFVVGDVADAVKTFGAGNYTDTGLDVAAGSIYVRTAANVVGIPVGSTTVVESAATFDAGIAMYVGMSVLAATGSAVVLKKKD